MRIHECHTPSFFRKDDHIDTRKTKDFIADETIRHLSEASAKGRDDERIGTIC